MTDQAFVFTFKTFYEPISNNAVFITLFLLIWTHFSFSFLNQSINKQIYLTTLATHNIKQKLISRWDVGKRTLKKKKQYGVIHKS